MDRFMSFNGKKTSGYSGALVSMTSGNATNESRTHTTISVGKGKGISVLKRVTTCLLSVPRALYKARKHGFNGGSLGPIGKVGLRREGPFRVYFDRAWQVQKSGM